MEFLSNLSTMQRGAGAVILVLLLALLLVKQRQAKAAPAGAKEEKTVKAKAPRAKREKSTREKPARSKEKKPRASVGKGRRRKGAEEAVAAVSDEPKAGRMVPRLPAAAEQESMDAMPTGEFDALAGATLAEPMTASDAGMGMINEPGWPTPGEVWGPDGQAPAEAAPVVNAVADHDDALSALTKPPVGDDAGWVHDDAEVFDPATGWGADDPIAEPEPVAELTDDSWSKPEEEIDWTSEDPTEAWAPAVADDAIETAVAEAAWEAPEDDAPMWTNTEETEWETAAEAEEAPAATATAVAEPEFSVNDWAAPDEEEETESPALVWDPVDETEAAEEADAVTATDIEEVSMDAPPAAEVEVEAEVSAPAVTFDHEPVVETEMEVVEEEPTFTFDAPVTDAPRPEVDAEVEEPADAEVEEPAEVAVEAPVAAAFRFDAPPVAEIIEFETAAPVEIPEIAEPELVEEPAFAVAEAPFEVTYGSPAVVAGASVADPISKWASLAPGGVETRPAADPVSSWARLQPGRVEPVNIVQVPAVAPVPTPVASPVAVAMAPSASPSVAWWDVPSSMESDPRRGRFALGGYALQPGHQVVSGVTFRDGVVPPPQHWVIGPVVGAVAPGTLVLEVDGCLNCRPEDLAVLMDPGFAPTTDGFSLKLMAAAQGPFAASGTYVIS